MSLSFQAQSIDGDTAARCARAQTLADQAKAGADETVAREAIIGLLEMLTEETQDTVRTVAAGALEDLTDVSAELTSRLIPMLQRPGNSDVVYWAVTLVGRIGSGAGEAVPTLVGVLSNSPFESVREKAAWALGRIGPEARAARGALEEAVISGGPRLRRLATAALESTQEQAAA